MTREYDAIIAGARCAGAATAMLLARRGLRVLVVDRSSYGADTISTHALMRGAVMQLARWGVLDAIKAEGGQPVTRATFHYGDEAVTVPIRPSDGVEALYAPKRTVLDPVLVDAARDSGAEVRYGVTLTGLIRSADGRVRGAALQDRAGAVSEVSAGLVIGADRLLADRASVAIARDGVRVDWAELKAAAAGGLEALATEEIEALAAALRGGFLEDLALPRCPDFEAWRAAEAAQAEACAARLLRALVERTRDEPERALGHAARLRAYDPDDEATDALIAELRQAAGRHRPLAESVAAAPAPAPPPAPAVGAAVERVPGRRARVRIGLDTGEAIVTQDARGLRASGAALRGARRLAHSLRRATIALTDRVRASAGGYLRLEPLHRNEHPGFDLCPMTWCRRPRAEPPA